MSKNLKNKRGAFTILELVVVLAILMVLILMITPKFVGHTAKANEVAAKNNARIVEQAAMLYLTEHPDTTDLTDGMLDSYISKKGGKGQMNYHLSVKDESLSGTVTTKGITVKIPSYETDGDKGNN